MMAFLDDDAIKARTQGAGPKLFLFHSLLSDQASFDRIVPELARHFQVIVPALPGFGGSAPVEGGLETVADHMAAFVRRHAARGEALLLGNGYGAFIALQIALRHPGLPAGLALAGCGVRFSDDGRQQFRNMAAAAAAKGLAAISDVAMRRLFAPEFQEANPELMADRRAAFLRTDPGMFNRAALALAEMDTTAQVAAVRQPVLLVVGDQDQATPAVMAAELAGLLPDARLTILDGCAHVPPLQAPERFLEAVQPFLAGAVPAATHAETAAQ